MHRVADVLRHRPDVVAQPLCHRRRPPAERPVGPHPVVQVAPQPQRSLQPPPVPRRAPAPPRHPRAWPITLPLDRLDAKAVKTQNPSTLPMRSHVSSSLRDNKGENTIGRSDGEWDRFTSRPTAPGPAHVNLHRRTVWLR